MYLTPDEARRFLTLIEDDPLGPLYTLAKTTGMRLGELLHPPGPRAAADRPTGRARRMVVSGDRPPATYGCWPGLAIVVCGIGAGWALLATTETGCWEAGRYRMGSPIATFRTRAKARFPMSPNAFAGGCDGGVLTARGAVLAALLGAARVGLPRSGR